MDPNRFPLFYPMLAMFLWTALVVLRNLQVRMTALQPGRLTYRYFELFRGAEPEERIVKTGNHLKNLTELPPLFYVVLLVIMMTGHSDQVFVALAWTYVGLRIIHSLVHLTINRVPMRFSVFA